MKINFYTNLENGLSQIEQDPRRSKILELLIERTKNSEIKHHLMSNQIIGITIASIDNNLSEEQTVRLAKVIEETNKLPEIGKVLALGEILSIAITGINSGSTIEMIMLTIIDTIKIRQAKPADAEQAEVIEHEVNPTNAGTGKGTTQKPGGTYR